MKITKKENENNSIISNPNFVLPDVSVLTIGDKMYDPVVWLIHRILLENEDGAI